jgi:hypothetical protein
MLKSARRDGFSEETMLQAAWALSIRKRSVEHNDGITSYSTICP